MIKHMKRLKLPQNKLARLAINIGFVLLWWLLSIAIFFKIWVSIAIFYNDTFSPPFPYVLVFPEDSFSAGKLFELTTFYVPIILATRYIWFGRIRPKRRITTSMDD